MPRYDFTSQRLYVNAPLALGASVELDRAQSNYLLNVLRLKSDASVLLFNGKDGEWQASLQIKGRKQAAMEIARQTRQQTPPYDLHYLFAPIKQARMEYMVQKAVEMGAGLLQPVFTQYTQLRKVNFDRMQTHVKEAAEQCGILNIATVCDPLPLSEVLQILPPQRQLIFCNEEDDSQNPLSALDRLPDDPVSVLIGPEGGFSPEERGQLLALPNVISIPLGPRVLRADTAAVAALAVIQAKIGDWRD